DLAGGPGDLGERADHRAVRPRPRPGAARGADREGAMSTQTQAASGTTAPATGTPPVIRVEGITKEYQIGSETVRALRGVDLIIERNEYVAVMGPSGSGKSTFMNVIGCLDVPTAGNYWLNGQS